MKNCLTIILISLLTLIFLYSYKDRNDHSTLVLKKILITENIIGTPPRSEKEYKIGVLEKKEERPMVLSTALFNVLNDIVKDKKIWLAPEFYSQNYFVTSSEEAFVFRDIYFDTQDNILDSIGGVVRLRYRWESFYSYEQYLKGRHGLDARPTRIEIQAKLGRQELGKGYSETEETRLEFSKESTPIKNYFDKGRARLLVPMFIESIKTGFYDGEVHYPAFSIAKYLKNNHFQLEKIQLKPKAMIHAVRNRFHINLISPWGSGPNPNHAFIVTIDRFTGDRLSADYKWEASTFKKNNFNQQPIKDEMVEIEVEFERNTSTKIDEKIVELIRTKNLKELAETKKIQNLFLQDQKMLREKIEEGLVKSGYSVGSVQISKYRSIILDNKRITVTD